jgi:hypothetical protein
MSNKQRITQLTKREKQAAINSGVLDYSLPESVRQRLENDSRTFDIETVLEQIGREVAWIRLQYSPPNMRPSEVNKQGVDTVAVIDELIDRIDHMHPDLAADMDELLYQSRGEFGPQLRERIAPDLYSIRSALVAAIQKRENELVRTGPKGDWAAKQIAVADILRNYAKGPISKAESKALAKELLNLCNVQELMKRGA